MEYTDLKISNSKIAKTDAFQKFTKLLHALEKFKVSDNTNEKVNTRILFLNQLENPKKSDYQKAHEHVKHTVAKNDKLYTENYHQHNWLAIGMGAFGLPIGLAFSAASGNYGFVGLGLPIGLSIGIALGTHLDKKAAKAGKQIKLA